MWNCRNLPKITVVEATNRVTFSSGYLAEHKVIAVLWQCGEDKGSFTLERASNYGRKIIEAAAIAIAEEQIGNLVLNASPPASKGHSVTDLKANRKGKISALLARTLTRLRKDSPEMPIGIKPMFGQRTRQGLVKLQIYNRLELTLSAHEAIRHGLALLRQVEMVRAEAFLHGFMADVADIEAGAAARAVVDFDDYRLRQGYPDEFRNHSVNED